MKGWTAIFKQDMCFFIETFVFCFWFDIYALDRLG